MTKRIVLAMALVIGAAGSANAQAISANASVAQVAQATGTQRDLVFPDGTPGGAGGSAVTAAATAANAAGPQLGFVEYELNYSGPSVGVAAPATLSDGTNTIAVTFSCGEADAAGTGLTLGACGTHNLTFAGTGLQTRRVWVGGTISQAAIDGAAASSTYAGTVTLTLTP